MRAAAIVPAFDVAPRVGEVVAGLRRIWPEPEAIFVVDDGFRIFLWVGARA